MELESQIRLESSQAASLSKEASLAFAARNFTQGRELMRQAVAAGKRCRALIQQLQQNKTLRLD